MSCRACEYAEQVEQALASITDHARALGAWDALLDWACPHCGERWSLCECRDSEQDEGGEA